MSSLRPSEAEAFHHSRKKEWILVAYVERKVVMFKP